jgi:hypothetical protein
MAHATGRQREVIGTRVILPEFRRRYKTGIRLTCQIVKLLTFFYTQHHENVCVGQDGEDDYAMSERSWLCRWQGFYAIICFCEIGYLLCLQCTIFRVRKKRRQN